MSAFFPPLFSLPPLILHYLFSAINANLHSFPKKWKKKPFRSKKSIRKLKLRKKINSLCQSGVNLNEFEESSSTGEGSSKGVLGAAYPNTYEPGVELDKPGNSERIK